MNQHGFVEYRRRELHPVTGALWTHTKRIGGHDVNFTNADVAPYNRWLTSKYGCHVNVEAVNKIRAVKYLFEYVYKVCAH